MANEMSLGEYLAQAQRSMGGGQFGRVSGPMTGYMFGSDALRKGTPVGGGTYLDLAQNTFTATYGKKVWDALNNKTVTFNAIKKVDWGPTVGWRLRTDRGVGRSSPVTETGNLPVIDVSNYIGVYSYPKQLVTTFGVSLKAQAVSALEGGIGNQFSVEQEASSRDHVKEINGEVMAGSAFQCITTPDTPAATAFAVTANAVTNFRVGDTVNFCDASDGSFKTQGGVISAINTTTGQCTISDAGFTPAAGDTVYIVARNGITGLTDACMADGYTVAATYSSKANVYNFTSRVAGTYSAGANSQAYAAGVGRDLTLPLVDSGFQTIRQNGGEPKLIVTGLDQYDNFNQLLQAQQRFVDVTDFIVGVGDDRTYPGTRAGFQLATYRGVPILPDPDTAKSWAANGTTALGSNFYMLDTDYLELAVMYPTQYVENRDYFAANALVIRGMFITMMELRVLRPDLMYLIANLNT